MSKLVPPHGGGELKPLLLQGQEQQEELRKAATLKKVPMTSREAGDLIMMGIGAFTPSFTDLRAIFADFCGALCCALAGYDSSSSIRRPDLTLSGRALRNLATRSCVSG